MTKVHDGNIFGVRALVQTQVVSETVPQLAKIRQRKDKKIVKIDVFISFMNL